MEEKNIISLVFKNTLNIKQFTDIYGEEGKIYIQNFIEENVHILSTFKENEAISFISNKLGKNIDLATSLFNFYIETQLKDKMIENLKEEVLEKEEEVSIYKKHIDKEDKENKALSEAINDLYNKRIVSKKDKVKLRMLKK